ncbi:flagellar basal body P-ring formation protein FlgA [Chromobacterium alkanivorans]|uniref:flagellar basal body P-ring formation chaperone FlgA n=1 Tax=Chromobacterium alkanivorans TaxID=1071719 RepID=UPI001968763D|nr:flagellar basal body P-ring formation chaperone FlgA [Chromobacterium alkanivorans]MBN3005502.1 flagellar basal body P-ring formation protein FlgA [Chromobacterium alkanivorans]
MKRAALLAVWAASIPAQPLAARSVVEVESRSVSWSQVLEGSFPAVLRRSLEARPLATGLKAGEARSLGRLQLLSAWRAALGVEAEHWPVRLPDQITVTRAGGAPAAPALLKEGEQALRARLSGECERLELQPERNEMTALLPPQGVSLAARLPAAPALARRMAVWLDVFEGSELYGSWPAWFQVSCLRPVYRVSRAVAKGEALSAANAEQTLADLTDAKPLSSLQGMSAARDLAAGTVLRLADVKPAALVRKGERVLVRLNSGAIRLEVGAEALGDGAMGQLVYVRRERDQAVFKAIVVANGVVDVL